MTNSTGCTFKERSASVNDKREWCAASLYLADKSPFTDAAFCRLSPSERTVLFTMFAVGQAGGAAAATVTLITAINGGGPRDSVTFISLLPASDTSTAILTKVKATGILKQLPIKMPQPSTALPARLRGILEDIFEIPRLDEAPRAASVVTLWATAHQQAAGAPGAQPQTVSAAQPQASPQPAAQPAAAAQPALGAQQQPAGVVPGSWPPPPRRHHPCHGQLRRRPPSHPRYGGTRPHLTALSSQAHNNSERRSPATGAG